MASEVHALPRLCHTYLVSDRECSVKAVVLDDGTASLRRADGADIRHAQGVAGVVATEVLEEGNALRPKPHVPEIVEEIVAIGGKKKKKRCIFQG